MMALLTSPEAWISLATLSAVEIVLGIDRRFEAEAAASREP